MSWLNSPKKLSKFIFLFVVTSLVLFYLSPTSFSYKNITASDSFSDDDNIDRQHINLKELNTTWDIEHNPWVIPSTDNKKNFLEQLTAYAIQGDSYNDLYSMDVQLLPTELTLVIPVYGKDALLNLNDLEALTLPIPFNIHIVCSSKLKPQIEDKIGSDDIKISVIDRSTTSTESRSNFAPGTAGASVWLQLLDEIDTDYVYLLDENAPVINVDEIAYLLQVRQQNKAYSGAFAGTRALVLAPNQDTAIENFCLPITSKLPNQISQPADMLLGGWLLEKAWYSYVKKDISLDSLRLPLGYYLSLNLNQQLNVPTVYLPPNKQQTSYNKQLCEQVQSVWIKSKSWRSITQKNRFVTALQHRDKKQSVMITVDGSKQFISLYPLLCRFKQYPVHLMLLGSDIDGETIKHALEETNCHHYIQVHDFTLMKEHNEDSSINQLVTVIQPKIMIQIKPADYEDSSVYHLIQTIAKVHQITEINLPENEIVHALWIPDLSLEALTNWNKVQIKLVVITDRRPHSLSRLLQSASKAIYVGDNVDIMIHMEQSADRVTRMLVNSFMWQHGQKVLRHRIRKGGLMPAIVESWYPSNNDEYAVLLEDDIEVSPLFYVWSKYAILKYRYSGNKEAYRLMYGISLYAPRNLELLPAGRVTYDPNDVLLPAGYPPHIPYASQIPCSWGGVYFPEHWREFHSYLVRRLEDLNLPKDNQVRLISVPGSRSDKWKKSWKKYFIELVYLRAYVMLYPNFEGFEAFSTNHVEYGTHVQAGKRTSVIGTFMVPLMQRDTILSQLPNQSLPLFDDLPVLDLWGQLQNHEKLETTASKYHQHVSTCPRTFGTFDPQEFFCVVDGPPDPLQEFPMSPKKPKPPVLVKDAVQPIRYNYIYEYTEEEYEKARNEMIELGPKPIDVAQLPILEEKFPNKDDEMLDLESDLDTLNRLYLKLNPENLEFLNDEKMDMENEEDFEDDEEEDLLEEADIVAQEELE